MSPTSLRRARFDAQHGMSALAAAIALTVIGGPLWLVFVTSAKSSPEAKKPTFALPKGWSLWDNYLTVLREGNLLHGFLNSCVVVLPAVTICLLLGALAAWVYARRDDRMARWCYYLSVVGVFLPPAVVTTIRVLSLLGIDRSRTGLMFFYCGAFVSMSVFLMVGFVKAIPVEIEEAARIDGASRLRVFRNIVLPALRPILATTMIVILLYMWNDFYFAFFLLGDAGQHTLPLGLYSFASGNQFELRWNLIFADVVLVSLPLLAVFVVGQKSLLAGLMAGAGK